jgi:hypothetical protein
MYLGSDEGPDSVDVRRTLKDAIGNFNVLAHYGTGTSERANVQLSAGVSLAFFEQRCPEAERLADMLRKATPLPPPS